MSVIAVAFTAMLQPEVALATRCRYAHRELTP
jgi:hypothetical protein